MFTELKRFVRDGLWTRLPTGAGKANGGLDIKTFVFGLGAQKAGTTWLQSQLAESSQADFGRFKEYHVWDAVDLDLFKEKDIRHKRKDWRRLPLEVRHWLRNRRIEHPFLRRRMQSDPEYYFDYFSKILSRKMVSMTGDFTPENGPVPESTFLRVKTSFADRGIRTKTVFLMRDPVERCLSSLKMFRGRGVQKQGYVEHGSDDDILDRYISSSYADAHTAYHDVVDKTLRVFGPQDSYFGFYENLFTPESIEQLAIFFEVDANLFTPESFSNKSRGKLKVSEAAKRRAAQHFAPVYDYCLKTFPQTQTLWRDSLEYLD